MDATEVATLVHAGKLLLLDVREPEEYGRERIAGGLLYPLSTFDADALPDDGERHLVFHCGSCKCFLMAAERHLEAGHAHTANFGGELAAWKADSCPVTTLTASRKT